MFHTNVSTHSYLNKQVSIVWIFYVVLAYDIIRGGSGFISDVKTLKSNTEATGHNGKQVFDFGFT